MNSTSSDRALTPYVPVSDAGPLEFDLDLYRSMGAIEVTLTAELGRRLITLNELLRLRIDDVLVFSRPIGEHVDLFAGNVLIGSAEILAADEKLAIRVADLLDKAAVSPNHEPEPVQTRSSEAQEGVISDEL